MIRRDALPTPEASHQSSLLGGVATKESQRDDSPTAKVGKASRLTFRTDPGSTPGMVRRDALPTPEASHPSSLLGVSQRKRASETPYLRRRQAIQVRFWGCRNEREPARRLTYAGGKPSKFASGVSQRKRASEMPHLTAKVGEASRLTIRGSPRVRNIKPDRLTT